MTASLNNIKYRIKEEVNRQTIFVTENAIGLFHLGLFLLVYLSNFSYVAWGIFSLSKNHDVVTSCNFVWVYDLFGISYGISYVVKGAHTFASTLKTAKSLNDMSNINNSTYVDHIFIPVLLVWGFVIIASISDKCLNVYLPNHKDIWDLCQATFYGMLSMVLLFVGLGIFEYVNLNGLDCFCCKQSKLDLTCDNADYLIPLIIELDDECGSSHSKNSTISV